MAGSASQAVSWAAMPVIISSDSALMAAGRLSGDAAKGAGKG